MQGHAGDIGTYLELLKGSMNETQTPRVQFCAAVALAVVLRLDAPIDAVEVLRAAITEPDRYSRKSRNGKYRDSLDIGRNALLYTGQGKGLPALIAGLRALPCRPTAPLRQG